MIKIKLLAILIWLSVLSSHTYALTETKTFTDSQGRTTLFRYSLDDSWDTSVPRGVVIFFHGNNSATPQEVVDGFFPAIEQDGLSRGLIPVVMVSPETRSPPSEDIRQWKAPDKLLLHEILQSGFSGSFTIDYNRVFFDGASQGTCFIHDFLPSYGEFYGGGFYGGCGCYNAPDPLWEPSETFKQNFKVFVHATQDDFLYESSQEGYGYYRYTIELDTRSDLVTAGSHCSAYWSIRAVALDWLTGTSNIEEEPFSPNWNRVFVGDQVVGVTVDENSTVYVLQNEENGTSSLYSSTDSGKSWDTISSLPYTADDIDAVGVTLFITNGFDIYRSVDQGATFSLLLSGGTNSSGLIIDQTANIYRGSDVIYKSIDFGESWQSLGQVPNFELFAFENSRFLNKDTLASNNPQIITGNPRLSFSSDGQPISEGGFAVGSAFGDDWNYIAADSASQGFFSNAAWDGSHLWALSRQSDYPYPVTLQKSIDRGTNWLPETLPSAYAEYYGYTTQVSAIDSDSIIVHGDFNSSWLTQDAAASWLRVYGARTFSNATLAIDPVDGSTYATDGESVFKLITVDPTLDVDGDGVLKSEDNCPDVFNSSQADLDQDGTGDACDPDIDGDGVANEVDAFPTDPNETADSDGDGLGDNLESSLGTNPVNADSDGDGFSDFEELEEGTNPNDFNETPVVNGLPWWLIYEATKLAN